MRRISRRPLAAGKLNTAGALCFGILLSVAGTFCVAVAVNGLASLLAVLTLASCLFIYTPLKRKTPLCVLIGAFPGAMPPLIGWTAARGRLDPEAWVLFAMVFLWQSPHFVAIAWMYREDYSHAGYMVLPKEDQRDSFVFWQSFVVSLLLIPLSLIPAIVGESGLAYSAGAVLAGFIFLLLRRTLCFLQIECRGPAVAVRFDRLSPRSFYSADAR
jgi:protoheme IX farnesyltransferase